MTPDNLKAAIIRASFEDPLINRAYRELAEYYGFLISPVCRGGLNTREASKTTSSTSRETSCRCSARSRNSAVTTYPTHRR